MKSNFCLIAAALLVLCAHAAPARTFKIQTEVYAKRTPGDRGDRVELVTEITESGNSQHHSKTEASSVPTSFVFTGLGQKIAHAEFTGGSLPETINVVIYEDDGKSGKNDGICTLFISSNFSATPTTVRCVREENDGRATSSEMNVVIRQIA